MLSGNKGAEAEIKLAVAFLKLSGWSWFGAVALPELLFWLVRLYWLNRPLFQFVRRRLLHMVPVILFVLVLFFLLIQIAPGDRLLFYTDGVTETQDATDEEFGMDRLLACLEESKGLSARGIIEYVIGSTKKFRSSQTERDDLTLVVIKVL